MSAPITALTIRRRTRQTCTCKGYAFPHRVGGGKCLEDGSGCFCGECGEATEPVRADFGYGALEAWGQRFVHSDVRTVSRCCEGELYADASLTQPYSD